MNSPGKNRFVCRVVRLKTALLGETGLPSKHAQTCPDCQAHFQSTNALESRLRSAATREMKPAPENLTSRIALAVRQAAPRPRRSRMPAFLAVCAGTAAAAAVAIMVARKASTVVPAYPAKQASAEIRPADLAKMVTTANRLGIQLLDSVEPSAEKLVRENPLAQELHSVRADARSALGFLARNFLPTDSARQFQAPTQENRG